MRLVQLLIKGDPDPVARFMGEGLNNRPSARTHWTRYSAVELRDGKTWLHFDVEPSTVDEAPLDIDADEKEDRFVSSAIYHPASTDLGDDKWEIIAAKPVVELRFRWRNPLTPASAGVWMRLILKRVADRLTVSPSGEDHDSRVWTFDGPQHRWESNPLFSNMTPAQFASEIEKSEYAAAEGADCELLSRATSPRWIVDVSSIDKPRKSYGLKFLDAVKGTDTRPLVATFKANGGLFPVNSRAVSTESLIATSLEARDIDLTCARREDGKGFIVEWANVSASGSDREELSLDSLYAAVARHYALGMASARSRNRLSFAPTRLQADGVRIQFDAGTATKLRQVIVDEKTTVTWTAGAASAVPVVLTFTASSTVPPLRQAIRDGNGPLTILAIKGDGVSHHGDRWVVNGVALDLKTFESASLTVRQTDGEAVYGQPPIAVDFRLNFSAASIQPVSDDPEIGFETVSAFLERERPVVIDLRKTNPPIRLEVREFADETQSRVLRIGVRSLAQTVSSYAIDAVVLDPSPLTAARVSSTTSVDPNGLLAEYTDDSDQAPEWEFASEGGDMNVALPPQVIGEEMIKGRLYAMIEGTRTEVPLADRPFDFRLSPSARLTLDRTDIDTARTLAPWSLRRLLGQRPGVVGAKLRKAQFELLYGLLTEIDDVPSLRVAELDALVGRVPFPDEFLDLLRRQRDAKKQHDEIGTLDDLRMTFSAAIAEFIKRMLYRPSWWPVFRDFTSRQQLTITGKGVSASLRPSRATASPFVYGSPHSTIKDMRTPLRGGVDWPFQSRNVYDELRSKPDSSSVTIEGLAFGTLGGWGKQTAEFNNGKTLIISETTMGRLDSVTVIRIGRIAMLWNRARHVIVYERSTRRAPRYKLNPPPETDKTDKLEFQSEAFDGFAALRKVREYIEITEQKRTYPDTSAARPIAGPLKASFFETTIIPVKSTWGRDIKSGFVIALRGPLETNEEKFFPFPKIFLKKARARGKGEGTVDHQLKDPSELLFYTSTRAEDGGDSDQWPAVADLDFPVIRPKGALPLPFKSRFARSRKQPDARVADFGQRRFTITVDPPEEAVDLMHGRLSEGIEARVSTVSLARGRLSPEANIPPGGLAGKVMEPLAVTHAMLHDGLAELRMQVAQARADGVESLGASPSFAAEVRTLVDALQTNATKLATDTLPQSVPSFNWPDEQKDWNDRFRQNLAEQKKSWLQQLDLAAVPDDDRKRVGQAALESVCGQIRQRINEVGFLPLQALTQIDLAQSAVTGFIAEFKKRVLDELHRAIDRAAQRYALIVSTSDDTDDDEDVDPASIAGLVELQKEIDALVNDFTGRLAGFDSDAVKRFADTLGEWFSSGDTGLIADVAKPVRDLANEIRVIAADILIDIAPVDVAEPDWEGIEAACKALLDQFEKALLAAIATPIKLLRAPMDGLIEGGRLKVLNQADDAVETACKAAADAIDTIEAATKFIEDAKTALQNIGDGLNGAFATLGDAWKNAPGPFDKVDAFRKDVNTWFDNLHKSLDDALPLGEVEKALEAASRTIADGLEGAAKQVERAVVDELRKFENDVSAVGLEVTRILATGPVNDAIACTRERLGYYYDAAKDLLDVTRASAIFNDLGGTVLNSLSAELPFDRIRDRLLPQLQGLDLSQLLPNFGGLKLEHLFPDLKAPDDGSDNDWIRIRHGFDKDRLTAFADVDVDKVIDGTPTVFILPPVSLKLRDAHFLASSRLELSSAGGKSQSTKASLNADWMLCLSDRAIVTLQDATLHYDSDGGFDFAFDAEKVELAPEFQFITQALKSLLPQEEGLTLTPIMPGGIRVELGLPLPDLTTGAFTLTGITLYAFMELSIVEGFEVRTGCWLSKPERPFGLAILFLGGGGWVGVEVAYRPPDRFITRVSIGISAGAFVAVNFGVARGSAGILFTAGVDFFRDSQTQGGQTLITLGILVWGEFSILGIASASLRMMMSVTYDADHGRMFGTGRVEVSIKICWCFTLRVSQTVRQNFVGGGGGSKSRALPAAPVPATGDKFSKAVRTVNSNVAL